MGTKHSRFILIFNGLLSVLTFAVANPSMATDLNQAALIPKPVSVKATGGSFELKSGAVVCIGEGRSELLPVANYLTDRLNPATGFNVTVQVAGVVPSSHYSVLEIDSSHSQLGKEG